MASARLAVLALLAAGCGSLRPEQAADGGVSADARVDAAQAARMCDPDRPMPSEPTTAGSMQGRWKVTWTCVRGCGLRRPGLTYSPELEVVGATQVWSNPFCAECGATQFGEVTVAGCIDVHGSTDFDSQCRFSYRVCEMDGELRGQVTWKEPGVSAMTWQLTGRR